VLNHVGSVRRVRDFTHLTCLSASILCCLATALPAWEFTSTPLCKVTDSSSETDLKLTYDGSLYTLELAHPDGWKNAEVFAIRFAPNGPFIQTTRQVITGNSLSVADAGFGNVLIGLQNNQVAQAILGDVVRTIDLTGASEPIEAFKRCEPQAALS